LSDEIKGDGVFIECLTEIEELFVVDRDGNIKGDEDDYCD
jgi:hypothetical protein